VRWCSTTCYAPTFSSSQCYEYLLLLYEASCFLAGSSPWAWRCCCSLQHVLHVDRSRIDAACTYKMLYRSDTFDKIWPVEKVASCSVVSPAIRGITGQCYSAAQLLQQEPLSTQQESNTWQKVKRTCFRDAERRDVIKISRHQLRAASLPSALLLVCSKPCMYVRLCLQIC
jgi:hypothetical protein